MKLLKTNLGQIRYIENKGDFLYNGNDVCACYGYTVDDKGNAVVLKVGNKFKSTQVLGSDIMFTFDTIASYLDVCAPKYSDKALVVYRKVCELEESFVPDTSSSRDELIDDSREASVKKRTSEYIRISSISPIGDGKYSVQLKGEDRKRKIKGSIKVCKYVMNNPCSLTNKEINIGDEYIYLRCKGKGGITYTTYTLRKAVEDSSNELSGESEQVVNKPDLKVYSGWIVSFILTGILIYQNIDNYCN